jgi:hypothetical protein
LRASTHEALDVFSLEEATSGLARGKFRALEKSDCDPAIDTSNIDSQQFRDLGARQELRRVRHAEQTY